MIINILKLGIAAGGVISLLFAVFHLLFYRLFDCKSDFAKVSVRNSKIYYTVNFALILFFVIFGLISLAYAGELSSGAGLGAALTASYAFFWLWRSLWQVVYFEPSKSGNKGKKPYLHYLLIAISAVLFIIYIAPMVVNISGAVSTP
ncbi:MAG: hypothetical protein JSW52_00275 [Candidatus Coatesbacteria bacterium]|nr:MAG: hypothetical protein JSW52_00275 [Candidatus Coatesbacteria bacterium]